MVSLCKRCGGQVLESYNEFSCLQCGWDPEASSNGSLSSTPYKMDLLEIKIRDRLSMKPTQVRRRKRRLMLRGLTAIQADEIIEKQLKLGLKD